MKRRDLLGLGLSLCVPQVRGAGQEEEVDALAHDFMRRTSAPGLALAIVRAGQPNQVRGYGDADLQARRPVTADTAFHIASVSKIVTGTAAIMMLEQHNISLDAPISQALDFPLAPSSFADSPITFRHLLTHTSGISDEEYGKRPPAPLALRELLQGYLASAQAYSGARPGTRREYSNIGYSLLGYLSARLAGQPFDQLTAQRLFQPLGMHHTAWSMAGLRQTEVATGYDLLDGILQPLPAAYYPDWPAGLLRTSAADFARFLQIFIEPQPYLRPASVAQMFAAQAVNVDDNIQQGLIWELRGRAGMHLASHFGSDPGVAAFACLDLDRRVGVLAFANMRDDAMLAQRDLLVGLLKRARA